MESEIKDYLFLPIITLGILGGYGLVLLISHIYYKHFKHTKEINS